MPSEGTARSSDFRPTATILCIHSENSIPFQTKSGNLTGNLDLENIFLDRAEGTLLVSIARAPPHLSARLSRAFNPSELARGPKRRLISPGAPPIPVTRDANRARLSIDLKRRSQPDVATTAEKRGTRTL